MEFQQILSNIVSGVAYGSVYGLIGMAIVLLYRTNHLFNFAQTELATFSVVIMFFLMKKVPYWQALPLALIIAFFMGSLLHISFVRIISERRNVNRNNLSVITIGLFSIFNSMSFYFFGDEPEPFPAMLKRTSFEVLGVNVQKEHILIFGTSLTIAILITLFFKFTKLGLTLEAIAENIEGARLRGVRASNQLAIAWGITTAVGALAGVLLAPTLFLSANMLILVFSYALISVVIGGLESPFGALVGGIIIGVAENFASSWPVLGPDLKFLAAMFILTFVLLFRPRGLWGRQEQRRV